MCRFLCYGSRCGHGGKGGLERLPSRGASGTRQRDRPHWVLVLMMSRSHSCPLSVPPPGWVGDSWQCLGVCTCRVRAFTPSMEDIGASGRWWGPMTKQEGLAGCDVLRGRQAWVLSDGIHPGRGSHAVGSHRAASLRTCLSLAADHNLRLWQDQPCEGRSGGDVTGTLRPHSSPRTPVPLAVAEGHTCHLLSETGVLEHNSRAVFPHLAERRFESGDQNQHFAPNRDLRGRVAFPAPDCPADSLRPRSLIITHRNLTRAGGRQRSRAHSQTRAPARTREPGLERWSVQSLV